jgi:hypothetical protein
MRAGPRQGPCGGARAGAGGSLQALFGTFVREDMARIKAAMPLISSVDAFTAALQNVRVPRALCMAGLVAGRCMRRRLGLRRACIGRMQARPTQAQDVGPSAPAALFADLCMRHMSKPAAFRGAWHVPPTPT